MDKAKLIEILSVQSHARNQYRMFLKIVRELKSISNIRMYLDDGNLYVTKGMSDIYPCIVSHIDTVHKMRKDLTPIEINGNITGFDASRMTQSGIGGDDKVGIFIALEVLKTLPYAKAVFFRDEETGCNGSYVANMEFFDDCSFVLQCDRRGNEDFIIDASGIELSGEEFQRHTYDIISSFGYHFDFGMMTDVMALKENGLNVACANISCGYYNPHQDNEYVNIKDVARCLNMVITLFGTLGDYQFIHRNKRKPKAKSKGSVYGAVSGSTYKYGSAYGSAYDFADALDKVSKKKDFEVQMEEWESMPASQSEIDDDIDEEIYCPNCGNAFDEECSMGIETDPYCDSCGCYLSEIESWMDNTEEHYN